MKVKNFTYLWCCLAILMVSLAVPKLGAQDVPSLACNDLVQVSLDTDCGGLTPDMLLEGTDALSGAFRITLDDGASVFGDAVAIGIMSDITEHDDNLEGASLSSYIGKGSIKFKVELDDDGTVPEFVPVNSCWGNVIIESNIIPEITGEDCTNFVPAFDTEGSVAPGGSAVVLTADQLVAIQAVVDVTGKTASVTVNGTEVALPSAGPVTIEGSVSKVAVAVTDNFPTGWANVRCDWVVDLDADGNLVATSTLIDAATDAAFGGTLVAPDDDFECAYTVVFDGCYECTTWCDGSGEFGDTAMKSGTVSGTVTLLDRDDVLAKLTGACSPEIIRLESQIIESGDVCGGAKVVNWIAEINIHGKKETHVVFSQGFNVLPIALSDITPPAHVELSCGDDSSPEGKGGQPTYLNIHKESDPACIPYDLHYTVVAGVEDKKIPYVVGDETLWIVVPVVTKETKTVTYCISSSDELKPVLSFLESFPAEGEGSTEIGSLSSFISYEAIPGDLATVTAAVEGHIETFDPSVYMTGGGDPVEEDVASSYCNIKVSSSDSDPIEVCGGGYKIFRSWVILDWCTGEKMDHLQIVEVSDSEDPTVTSSPEGPVELSISPWTCEVDLSVVGDLVTFSDNCDASIEKTVRVAGHLNSVGVGTYTAIVTGTDDCGNHESAEVQIVVIDGVPPTPVCQDEVLATLASDPNKDQGGVAKVYASAFDAGSHDAGCGSVSSCVARMEDVETRVEDCTGFRGYVPVTCGALELAYEIELYATDSKGACVKTGETALVHDGCYDFVKFCCEDVGGDNMVRVTYSDKAGNENICMVPVTVVDKSAASCANSSVEITCVDNIDDKVSSPSVNGSACGASFVHDDSGKVDGCGQGTIVRSWYTDEDGSGDFTEGDSYKCRTVVTVKAAGGFDPYSIKWPKHYDDGVVAGINLECGDEDSNNDGHNDVVSTEKSDIAMGNSFNCVPDADAIAPVWCEYNCGLIAYEYQDDTLTASDACLKILRRWTVIDWCAYEANGNQNGDDDNDTARDEFEAVEDWAQGECSSCEIDGRPDRDDNVYFRYKDVDMDGYYTFDQVIKVVDDTAPEIDVVDTMYVDIVGGKKSAEDGAECFATGSVTATAEDFCGGEMYSADGLVWNVTRKVDGSTVASKREVGGSVTMGTGEGTDGDEAVIDWVVKDGCGNATTGRTIVIFRDNKAPTPVCIAGLTTAVMPVGGTVAIWAKDYDRGSFDNCTATDDLVFAIVRRGTELDLDAAIAGELTGKEYTCEDLGNSNADQLDVYVIDAHGNHDFCTVSIIIEDNEGVCGDPENGSVALISGSVSNENGDMVEAATVTVNANLAEYPRTYVTESNGQYAFNNAEMNADYELSVEKADTYGTGVSTADLVLIQKHLLGLRDLDSPYKVIAADANGSGSVTTADIAELRRVILGLKSDLANAPAWRFVDASQDLSADPFTYSENIAIADLASNMTNQNFVATKTGDVNVSANTLETRANGMVSLTTAEVEFEAGQRVEVPVSGANFADVVGYQLTMNHAGLELVDVKAGAIAMGIENVGQFEEALTMSWNNASGVSTDEVLFTLVFNARTAGSLAESLSVTDKVTVSEAYVGSDLERKSVVLTVGSGEAVATGFELYQNEPNPFEASTVVGFELPSAGEASLTVYDVAGKVLYELVDNYGAGYNEVNITKAQIQVNGVLYYQLQSGEFTATKKMVVIE